MCMEDIRIGRASSGQFQPVPLVASTVTLLISANVRRTALLISNPTAQPLYVGPRGIVTGVSTGIVLPTQAPVLKLHLEDVGSALWQDWFYFTAALSGTLFVISTELDQT